ncbi:hypothetical protein Tco_0711466 [Tanacetum coccineum]
MDSIKKCIAERSCRCKMQECKVTVVQAFDANLVVMERSGTESAKQLQEFVDSLVYKESENENSVSVNENNRFENKNSKLGISNSISGNAMKADGADIRPTYNTDSLC